MSIALGNLTVSLQLANSGKFSLFKNYMTSEIEELNVYVASLIFILLFSHSI